MNILQSSNIWILTAAVVVEKPLLNNAQIS
jgi:hypothetical protein